MLPHALELCAARRSGRVIALTGAGISAESGIPTFRGKEGYWTVGAREYRPQELATFEAFEAMPDEVWAWYLHRRGVCQNAAPNAAHLALAACERALLAAGGLGPSSRSASGGETWGSSQERATAGVPGREQCHRFALVTQNVDGLHRRAGSASLHEIHGNIDLARCAAECTPARFEVTPERLCPRCGGPARPHVLWFDESYDEERYHLHTVRTLAARADLLIVVGTSAQTNLPWQVVRLAADAGAAIIDVNVEDNPFSEIARGSGGAAVRGTACDVIPRLAEAITAA